MIDQDQKGPTRLIIYRAWARCSFILFPMNEIYLSLAYNGTYYRQGTIRRDQNASHNTGGGMTNE